MEVENKMYCTLCSLSATCMFTLCLDQQNVSKCMKIAFSQSKKRKYVDFFFIDRYIMITIVQIIYMINPSCRQSTCRARRQPAVYKLSN